MKNILSSLMYNIFNHNKKDKKYRIYKTNKKKEKN